MNLKQRSISRLLYYHIFPLSVTDQQWRTMLTSTFSNHHNHRSFDINNSILDKMSLSMLTRYHSPSNTTYYRLQCDLRPAPQPPPPPSLRAIPTLPVIILKNLLSANDSHWQCFPTMFLQCFEEYIHDAFHMTAIISIKSLEQLHLCTTILMQNFMTMVPMFSFWWAAVFPS